MVGAPDDKQQMMKLLVQEYNECSATLTRLGFNGCVLNLEPRKVAENETLPDDEEAQIKHIVDNKLISKAGGLFKAGIVVANARVVVEAAKRVKAEEEKKKEEKAEKDKVKEATVTYTALHHFGKWVADGKKYDNNKNPVLSKAAAVAIAKVLLPRIAPKEKVSDYATMKKCNEWLGSIAGGTTWETEMEQYEKEQRETVESRRLFTVTTTHRFHERP